ncbi:hypothetical protein RFI_07234 [Reticulomyxa filosa]|uniref:Uncharacterized protein n=1 Tax=Reticulomyxa filosa TaxID=46433 RepID=X6NVQ3_RETFI|nr:hypothetical protein RFI_07234 [Reticulomyxa filosa]|eukprot:ETO29884.1 hypothetical protein RFI_07234 [Reticulomyxa filosa]
MDRSEEENEIKILREMYLHILWNILKYPKHIKYRQIHKQALYNYLSKKSHTLGADFEKVLIDIEKMIIGIISMIMFNYYIYGNVIAIGSINKSCMSLFCYIKQDIGLKEDFACYGIKNVKIMKVYLIMNIEQ